MYCEPNGSHRELRACFLGLFLSTEELSKVAVVEGTKIGEQPRVVKVPAAKVELLLSKLGGKKREFKA